MNNADAMTVGVADLFRLELEHCADWPSDRLLRWVRWFIVKGRYLVSVKDGRLEGVCLWRRVDCEDDCHKDYCDTGGAVCYVDALVATSTEIMKEIFTEAISGPAKDCRTMAWVRPKHNDKIVCVPMERARRRLIKG